MTTLSAIGILRLIVNEMKRLIAGPRSQVAALAVLCGALAVVMGSMTSLTTGLPEIGRATGATQGELTWIVDSYTVVFAGLLLPCGALGDRYGRRRMLTWGLLVFAAGCLLGPVGDDPTVLVLGRAVAGLGAALVMPATLSLITTTLRGAAQERAVGLWVATATLAAVLGVVFSGLVLEFADWRAILYASAATALVIAAAGGLVEESCDPDRPPFDLAGAVTSVAAIGLVVVGILEAPSHGWASSFVWSCVLGGLVLAAVFTAVELRRSDPLLDVRIFGSREVTTGSLGLVALFAVIFGFFFLAVQFLQLIEGRSPLGAGMMLLPAALTMVPLSLVASALAPRVGLRLMMTLGLIPLVAALVLVAQLDRGETGLLVCAELLFGTSIGLCITPATVAILRSVPAGKQGVASAVNDAVREVGAALGIAVVGSLLATGYSRDLGPATAALPEPARSAAEASLAGALQVGAELGPAAGPAVAEAELAFVAGMQGAFLALALFVTVIAVVVAVAAPGRRRAEWPDEPAESAESAESIEPLEHAPGDPDRRPGGSADQPRGVRPGRRS